MITSSAQEFSSLPISIHNRAKGAYVFAFAMWEVISPLSLIMLTFIVYFSAIPIDLTIDPLTFIGVSILAYPPADSIRDEFIYLALINLSDVWATSIIFYLFNLITMVERQ